jgi:tape measure domain-containing protein
VAAIGSMRVELELADGSFTTRVIRAGTTLQQLERQVRRTVVAVRTLDDSAHSASAGVRDLVVTLGLARAAVENVYNVFGRWVTSIVKINAEVERSTTLLKNMSNAATDSARTVEARKDFEALLDLSSQAPYQLQTLTNAFVKMKAAGIEPAMAQLKGLTNAAAAMGATDEQFARASIAIQQMAGKGVVSMEELRQQLGEAIPRAIELMARSMNMTVAQFTQKVSQGQVAAKGALASMSAEFERTFGGAAAAQMDTFAGKITQLQTAWTKFALQVGGLPGSGGFFDATKEFVQKLTDTLSSAEAGDFARKLNTGLADLTRTLITGIDVFLKWADTIATVARSLAIMWIAVKGYAILAGMVVAINQWRIATLAAAASQTALTAAWSTSVMPALAGMVTGFRNATAGAVMFASASGLGGVVNALGTFGAAMASVVSRLAGFTRALFSIGGAGFVIGALALIADAFINFKSKATEAKEALDAFKEGASDPKTMAGVQASIDQMTKEIERHTKAREANRKAFENELKTPTSIINTLRNRADQGVPGALDELNEYNEEISRISRQHTAEIVRLETERASLREQLAGASEQRLMAIAKTAADRELSAFSARIRALSNAYDQQFKKEISAPRDLLTNKNDPDGSKKLALDKQARVLREKLYDDEIKMIDDYATQLADSLEKANDADRRRMTTQLTILKQMREAAEQRKAAGNLDGGADLVTANAENNMRVANNQMAQMTARIAEMKAQMSGLNPEAAQMAVLLEKLSRMEGLSDEHKTKMLELATAFGQVKADYEKFTKALTASRQINTGLDKAATDVAFFMEKLHDIDLPAEEKQFLQFERAMLAAFQNVAAAADTIPGKVNEIRNAMLDAIEAARTAAGLSFVTSYLEGQRDDLVKLAPKGSAQRLEARLAGLKADYARAKGEAIKTLTGDSLVRALNDIDERYKTKMGVANLKTDGEATSAGRKTASMLETLKARYAELGDELNDGAGQVAKYWSRLGDSGRASAAGQEILAVAAKVDEMTIKVEKAQNAWSALKAMLRQGDEGRNELTSVFEILATGSDTTGIEMPFLQAAAKARRAYDDLVAAGVDGGARMKAASDQLQALPGIAQGLLANQVTNWKNAQRQIRESTAVTLDERREMAMENIQIEEESWRRLIAAAELGAEQRKKIELELDAYLTALRKKAAQEHEGPLRKMLKEWIDFSQGAEGAMVRAFDGMADALTEFVMTGKANFNDLANSFIRDMIRISMKAAASGFFELITGGASGGGAGSILKALGGFAAKLIGGSASSPMANVDANYAASNHSGGIVGGYAKMMKVSAGLFNNAPRFHGGGVLKSNEVPTVLERGEGVFTADQMAVIGRMNQSYTFVEQMLASMNRAITSIPTSAQPSMPQAPSGGAGGTPGAVTVNLINQSGQQLEAVAGTPRIDLEGMIIDVVVSNMQRPGRLRDTMRGAA